MSRRFTALDLPDSDRWSLLTDEQRERALATGESLRERAEKIRSRLARIKDPMKRLEAIDFEAQVAAILYSDLIDMRDETVDEIVDAATSRSESAKLTEQVADLLLLSVSRVRQIRSRKNIGTHQGPRHVEISRILTRDYLADRYGKQGMTMEAIATAAGVEAQTVSKYLARYLREDIDSGIPEADSPFRSRTRADYAGKKAGNQ